MRKRLLLMHDVARWKWNEQASIADPDREKQVLDGIVEKAGPGLDPEFVRFFFAAQIEAAKVIQHADFERWKSASQGPFPDAPDLSLLRKQIDQINIELLATLLTVVSELKPTSASALDRQVETVLGPDLNAQERGIAVEPLRQLLKSRVK